jgi:hypothetical protein
MARDSAPRLRASYLDGRLLPFIGAGISRSIEWKISGTEVHGPSWNELVDQATRELGFENPELARVRGTDLQILEYFKRKNGGQTAKLTNWLTRLMSPPDDALRASPILSALVELDKCRIIYTTNYDDFIERSFLINKKSTRTVVLESQMGRNSGEVEIVKFHGDLNHPGQIVLTESDYEKRLALSCPLDSRLRADLLGRVVLFLGYSFRDANVSYLFRRVTEESDTSLPVSAGPRAYIALPDPSDFEYTLFEDRRIQVIPLEGAAIETDIATLLHDLSA